MRLKYSVAGDPGHALAERWRVVKSRLNCRIDVIKYAARQRENRIRAALTKRIFRTNGKVLIAE